MFKMKYLFYITLFVNWYQSDGLRCFNCHTKCLDTEEGKLNCEYANIYLNSISYNRSRDGYECPSDYEGLSNPKYIEECEKDTFCGKREISIHVRVSSQEKLEKVNAPVTAYPILDTKRIYHRVYGCMRPQIDCDKKTYNKVVQNKSSSKNETITISGKIVEEADCSKCQQDLCNGEEPQQDPPQSDSTHKPSHSFANRNGDSMIIWILSALMVNTAAKLLAPCY